MKVFKTLAAASLILGSVALFSCTGQKAEHNHDHGTEQYDHDHDGHDHDDHDHDHEGHDHEGHSCDDGHDHACHDHAADSIK